MENCRNEPEISPSWAKKIKKHFCLEMPSCHTHSSNLCDTAPMLCLFWSVHTDGAGRRGRITLQRTFLGCGPFAGFTEFRKLKETKKQRKSPLHLLSSFHCHHWLQNFMLFFLFPSLSRESRVALVCSEDFLFNVTYAGRNRHRRTMLQVSALKPRRTIEAWLLVQSCWSKAELV